MHPLVERAFANYYQERTNFVSSPTDFRRREFGFVLPKKKIMLRHKGFESIETLQSFLASMVPSDVYYSVAYYENPTADMDRKGWQGADLVFDIDADHIPTQCARTHDSWSCNSCGAAGKGSHPRKCPKCGQAKFDTKTWTCSICLESAKKETAKLTNMLIEDFGFASNEVKVYFSGNRGYHVHVENENIRKFDSMMRKEIVDYVIGLGFDEKLHQLLEGDSIAGKLDSDMVGWKARVVKGVHEVLTKATLEKALEIGLSKHVAESLIASREMLLENIKSQTWLRAKGVGARNWRKIIEWVLEKQSAKIDTVVTTDVHRLIRLVGSLHGKTGFMKVEVPLTDLGDFDPLDAAIAFKGGHMIVDIIEAPEFRVSGNIYGPFNDARSVVLPMAAAIFLLCHDVAQVVEK